MSGRTARSHPRSFIDLSVPLLLGSIIGFVDSRASWDDTAITAAALFTSAALLACARPQRWLLAAVALGIPVVAWNVVRDSNATSLLALLFTLAGASIGAALRRAAAHQRAHRNEAR